MHTFYVVFDMMCVIIFLLFFCIWKNTGFYDLCIKYCLGLMCILAVVTLLGQVGLHF